MLAIGEPAYWIVRAKDSALDTGAWDDAFWREANVAEIEEFVGPSSDHRPTTEVKLVYDNAGVHGLFRVRDRYVLSTRTEFQAPVYRDACVEFFLRPSSDASKGYFNSEMNCGGTLLASYIENPARTATGFEKFTPLTAKQGAKVSVAGSMGARVDPEISDPVTWTVQFFVPHSISN